MSCDVGKAREWALLILQAFSHFAYVTAHSDSPSFPSLHLRHSSFSNPSVALPTSQLILQLFRCFTNATAHSPTLLSPLLRHRIFTYVTWRAAHDLCDTGLTLWIVAILSSMLLKSLFLLLKTIFPSCSNSVFFLLGTVLTWNGRTERPCTFHMLNLSILFEQLCRHAQDTRTDYRSVCDITWQIVFILPLT